MPGAKFKHKILDRVLGKPGNRGQRAISHREIALCPRFSPDFPLSVPGFPGFPVFGFSKFFDGA
jgi:hypothetical protein